MTKAAELLQKIRKEGYWYTSDRGLKFVNLPEETHKELEQFVKEAAEKEKAS